MDMNDLSRKLIIAVLGMLAFVFILGIAGKMEYTEEVIYNMPDKAYEEITSKMQGASDYEIAREYLSNQEYYDTLKW